MHILWLIIKLAILAAVLFYGFKITRALIREPNLRFYLKTTAKDLKHLYNRYHV